MAGPREVVEAYWKAEESRDLGAVLEHYAEDAELVVPTMGRLAGHGEIRRFYEESIDRFPDLQVQVVGGVVDGMSGAFEWQSVHRDPRGREYPASGVNVVQVRDAKLQKVHVYFDPTVFGAES